MIRLPLSLFSGAPSELNTATRLPVPSALTEMRYFFGPLSTLSAPNSLAKKPGSSCPASAGSM